MDVNWQQALQPHLFRCLLLFRQRFTIPICPSLTINNNYYFYYYYSHQRVHQLTIHVHEEKIAKLWITMNAFIVSGWTQQAMNRQPTNVEIEAEIFPHYKNVVSGWYYGGTHTAQTYKRRAESHFGCNWNWIFFPSLLYWWLRSNSVNSIIIIIIIVYRCRTSHSPYCILRSCFSLYFHIRINVGINCVCLCRSIVCFFPRNVSAIPSLALFFG